VSSKVALEAGHWERQQSPSSLPTSRKRWLAPTCEPRKRLRRPTSVCAQAAAASTEVCHERANYPNNMFSDHCIVVGDPHPAAQVSYSRHT